jgi:hypothetical protein
VSLPFRITDGPVLADAVAAVAPPIITATARKATMRDAVRPRREVIRPVSERWLMIISSPFRPLLSGRSRNL